MTKEEMLHLKLSGVTYSEVARRAGISKQRVAQILQPPRGVRDLIVERAYGLCESCGVEVGRSGHIHHRGGDFDTYNDISQLELLCASCHMHKHATPKIDKPWSEPAHSLDDALGSKEAAEILGVSTRRVLALAQSRKVGSKLSGCWIFTHADIEEMRRRRTGGIRPLYR